MYNFAPMNRKNLLFAAGAGLILLASCQGGQNNPNIKGKWQATAIDIPSQDSLMRAQMKMQTDQIDALTTVDSAMIKRFGTSDLETIKKMAKEEVAKQPEQTKEEMKRRTADISFELMDNGKALSSFGGPNSKDSVRWYFGDEGKKLFLDPLEVKNENPMGGGQVMIFDVVYAGSDSLRLRVHQQVGQDVFLNFRPAKDGEKKAEEKK